MTDATNPTVLLELAERCEQATGPDRAIDADICVAALGYVERQQKVRGWRDFETPEGYLANFREDGPDWEAGDGWKQHFEIPPFTSSLDAAMTLVPEEWSIGLGDLRGLNPVIWRAHLRDHRPQSLTKAGHSQFWEEGHAATPALALCAAALRSRATITKATGGTQ